MPLTRRLLGRWVLPALILGLGLMHAGVGPASACTAMPGMAAVSGIAEPTGADHGSHDRQGGHGHGAVGHAGQMCLSTPAADHALTTPAAVRRPAAAPLWSPPRPLGALGAATGRHPPPPDPVSTLCVDRQ